MSNQVFEAVRTVLAVREYLDKGVPDDGLPASYDVIAVVPFGYPQHPATKGKKNRKQLAEVASAGHYGAPFE